MSDKARAELAPTGVLRAGINLSNFLLVTGRSEKAEPVGVAPDMAQGDRRVARRAGHLRDLQVAGRARRPGGQERVGHRPDRRRAAARGR